MNPGLFPAGWKPRLYTPLFAQTPMGEQANLFGSIAPGTTPAACPRRFDPCAQITLAGGTARICTLCGAAELVGSGTAQSWPEAPVVFEFPKEGEDV